MLKWGRLRQQNARVVMGRHSQSLVGLGLVGLAMLLLLITGMGWTEPNEKVRLALALSLLAVTGLGAGLGLQPGTAAGLRQLLIWSACVVGAAIVITYRGELSSAMGPYLPVIAETKAAPSPATQNPGTVTLRAEGNGHFFASALVNGKAVDFLIDTGATDVALAPEDAVRLGIDLAKLDYSIPILTANGKIFGALTELEDIVIGGIHIDHVSATIPRAALERSLLGMSFLKRLSSYTIDGDRLVMRQ
jgi:aspartyl protease family protein